VGVSGLYGPNATGADTDTFILGADLYLKRRDPRRPAARHPVARLAEPDLVPHRVQPAAPAIQP
ncbi:MAG: hypothetical protein O7A68_01705, partial [Alphaproteobacteria bacterium]|nr:hypothetical protein [Alphaproteobacteria bacterium]